MWLHLSVLLFASALAFGQTAKSKPPGAQIEGTVVSAINGQLLPRAMVILHRGSKQGPVTLGRADDNAHFLVDQLDSGSYVVSAAKQGYFTDEHRPGQEIVVELAAGAQAKDVLVRLMPLGVIAGRIVDEANDPIRGAEVRLLAQEHYRGREFLNTMNTALTDDRGEYRIYDVKPGSYFLLAEHNETKEWEKASGTCHRKEAASTSHILLSYIPQPLTCFRPKRCPSAPETR